MVTVSRARTPGWPGIFVHAVRGVGINFGSFHFFFGLDGLGVFILFVIFFIKCYLFIFTMIYLL